MAMLGARGGVWGDGAAVAVRFIELAGGYHQRAVLVGAGVGESGCVLLLLLLLLLLLPMSTMRLRTLQASHAEMEYQYPHDT